MESIPDSGSAETLHDVVQWKTKRDKQHKCVAFVQRPINIHGLFNAGI